MNAKAPAKTWLTCLIGIFGLNGFILGPLIAAIFMVSWEIFRTPDGADDQGES